MGRRRTSKTTAKPKLSIGKRVRKGELLNGAREKPVIWDTLVSAKGSTGHELRILFTASNPLGSVVAESIIVVFFSVSHEAP